MNGLLLVDKPAGWTSHDVVAKVRSLLKAAGVPKPKVGHSGTLDPFATGLLILLIGSYTKKANEFLKLDKTYEVTLKLGETSTTGDPEGTIKATSNKQLVIRDIKKVLQGFLGEIEQVPPVHSALKVGGQRAYKLARQGKTVELDPRKVKIYSIRKVKYDYPNLSFTVKVSSGTYIRSLVRDIGDRLGTGAYCTSLRRTHIGRHSIKEGLEVRDLTFASITSHLATT